MIRNLIGGGSGSSQQTNPESSIYPGSTPQPSSNNPLLNLIRKKPKDDPNEPVPEYSPPYDPSSTREGSSLSSSSSSSSTLLATHPSPHSSGSKPSHSPHLPYPAPYSYPTHQHVSSSSMSPAAAAMSPLPYFNPDHLNRPLPPPPPPIGPPPPGSAPIPTLPIAPQSRTPYQNPSGGYQPNKPPQPPYPPQQQYPPNPAHPQRHPSPQPRIPLHRYPQSQADEAAILEMVLKQSAEEAKALAARKANEEAAEAAALAASIRFTNRRYDPVDDDGAGSSSSGVGGSSSFYADRDAGEGSSIGPVGFGEVIRPHPASVSHLSKTVAEVAGTSSSSSSSSMPAVTSGTASSVEVGSSSQYVVDDDGAGSSGISRPPTMGPYGYGEVIRPHQYKKKSAEFKEASDSHTSHELPSSSSTVSTRKVSDEKDIAAVLPKELVEAVEQGRPLTFEDAALLRERLQLVPDSSSAMADNGPEDVEEDSGVRISIEGDRPLNLEEADSLRERIIQQRLKNSASSTSSFDSRGTSGHGSQDSYLTAPSSRNFSNPQPGSMSSNVSTGSNFLSAISPHALVPNRQLSKSPPPGATSALDPVSAADSATSHHTPTPHHHRSNSDIPQSPSPAPPSLPSTNIVATRQAPQKLLKPSEFRLTIPTVRSATLLEGFTGVEYSEVGIPESVLALGLSTGEPQLPTPEEFQSLLTIPPAPLKLLRPHCLLSNHPLTVSTLSKTFCAYFELFILAKHPLTTVSIGLALPGVPETLLPGFGATSIAILSDGSRVHRTSPTSAAIRSRFSRGFGVGGVVGCGYIPAVGGVFFTYNGEFLGEAFSLSEEQSAAIVNQMNSAADNDTIRNDGVAFHAAIGADGPAVLNCNFGADKFLYEPANEEDVHVEDVVDHEMEHADDVDGELDVEAVEDENENVWEFEHGSAEADGVERGSSLAVSVSVSLEIPSSASASDVSRNNSIQSNAHSVAATAGDLDENRLEMIDEEVSNVVVYHPMHAPPPAPQDVEEATADFRSLQLKNPLLEAPAAQLVRPSSPGSSAMVGPRSSSQNALALAKELEPVRAASPLAYSSTPANRHQSASKPVPPPSSSSSTESKRPGGIWNNTQKWMQIRSKKKAKAATTANYAHASQRSIDKPHQSSSRSGHHKDFEPQNMMDSLLVHNKTSKVLKHSTSAQNNNFHPLNVPGLSAPRNNSDFAIGSGLGINPGLLEGNQATQTPQLKHPVSRRPARGALPPIPGTAPLDRSATSSPSVMSPSSLHSSTSSGAPANLSYAETNQKLPSRATVAGDGGSVTVRSFHLPNSPVTPTSTNHSLGHQVPVLDNSARRRSKEVLPKPQGKSETDSGAEEPIVPPWLKSAMLTDLDEINKKL
ncbi:Rsp5p-dependent ubiquitination, sorting of cargo proteins at the multivesicular body [Chytridiales sp. JEL 0842]|nr:Rsp5p-dependent ubiquitination, sorting of cargo proteins at the multivesicular body [Chytridiales sp. JEL 0842]